jgi:hypothetical protein
LLLVGYTILENAFKRLPRVARQSNIEKMFGAGPGGPKSAVAIASILPMESARPKDSRPRTVAEGLPL